MVNEITVTVRTVAEQLLYTAVVFASIALLVNGTKAIAAARKAFAETRLNIKWAFLDAILVAPALAAMLSAIMAGLNRHSLRILNEDVWKAVGAHTTFFLAVFIGDLISWARHRLEHTRWLWPAHAIHHSDTQMTWLTLARFHPIDRLTTTLIDVTLLALLGFPVWAIVANEILCHYYGEFIHAKLPWTYGPLGRVFVSPAMHQWHHARDVVGAGSNFATIFSVFDQAFGTYYLPGPCNVPLGVTDNVGPGIVRQFTFPFVCWFKDMRELFNSRRAVTQVDTA